MGRGIFQPSQKDFRFLRPALGLRYTWAYSCAAKIFPSGYRSGVFVYWSHVTACPCPPPTLHGRETMNIRHASGLNASLNLTSIRPKVYRLLPLPTGSSDLKWKKHAIDVIGSNQTTLRIPFTSRVLQQVRHLRRRGKKHLRRIDASAYCKCCFPTA